MTPHNTSALRLTFALCLFLAQSCLAAHPAAAIQAEADKAGALDRFVFDTGLIPVKRGLPGPELLWLSLEGKTVAVFETDEPPRQFLEKSTHSNVYAYSEGDPRPSLVYKDAKIACFVPPDLLVLQPSNWQKQQAMLMRQQASSWRLQETHIGDVALRDACPPSRALFSRGRRSAGLELAVKAQPYSVLTDLFVKEQNEEYSFENYAQSILTIRQTAAPSKYVISELSEASSVINTSDNTILRFPSPAGKLSLPISKNFYSFPARDFKHTFIAPGTRAGTFGVYLWDGTSATAEKLLKLQSTHDSWSWVSVSSDHCFAAFTTLRRTWFLPYPTINFVNLCSLPR